MRICKAPVNRLQKKVSKKATPPTTEPKLNHFWKVTDWGTHMNLICPKCNKRTDVDHNTDVEEEYPYCPKCGHRVYYNGKSVPNIW